MNALTKSIFCLMILLAQSAYFSCGNNSSVESNSTKFESNKLVSDNSVSNKDDFSEQDWIVTNGVGTKKVKLGVSEQEIVRILGEPEMRFDFSDTCPSTLRELFWSIRQNNRESTPIGIRVFFNEFGAFQILFYSGRYVTDGGVEIGSRFDIESESGFGKFYELPRSSSNASNGYRKHFFIGEGERLALELAYVYSGWTVNAIWVFEREDLFQPDGCKSDETTLFLIDDTSNYIPKQY